MTSRSFTGADATRHGRARGAGGYNRAVALRPESVPNERGYAVVSCHVERMLADRTWALVRALGAARPGGFSIAALILPPDRHEDGDRWLERAREASTWGPVGHHTHFGGGNRARPRTREALREVEREARWLRERGVRPRLFSAGGWYMDRELAGIVAGLGYADLSGSSFWSSWLPQDVARLALERPAWLRLDDGRRLLEIPTTHYLGRFLRGLALPRRLPPFVHVSFHDWELRDGRRRLALSAALRLLARLRRPVDLELLADELVERAPELPLDAALRTGPLTRPAPRRGTACGRRVRARLGTGSRTR